MALDIAKLENVKRKTDDKLTARCPACAAQGDDNKGEHLVVFPDGRYGCVVNPGDKGHSKIIFELAGEEAGACTPTRPFEVSRAVMNSPTKTLVLDRFSIERLKSDQPPAPVSLCPAPGRCVLDTVEGCSINSSDVSDAYFSYTREKMNGINVPDIKRCEPTHVRNVRECPAPRPAAENRWDGLHVVELPLLLRRDNAGAEQAVERRI
jgi:hypothetical protein